MSVKVMTGVWELDLPAEQQQIMLALADHAHDNGSRCYPGVPYMAWKVGKSQSAVRRILAKLREEGLIRAIAYEKGGRGHATEYAICLEKGSKKPAFINEGADLNPSAGEINPGVSDETLAPVHINPSAGASPTVINHQRTIREPGTGRIRAAPRGLSDEDRSKLVAEYGPVLGDEAVRDHIADALSHTAVKKWTDTYRYVRNWLSREAKNGRAGANRIGAAGNHPKPDVDPAFDAFV